MILQKNISLYKPGIFLSLPFLIITSVIFSLSPNGGIVFLIPALVAIIIFIALRKLRAFKHSQHQGEFENFQARINLLRRSLEEKENAFKMLPTKEQRTLLLFDISKNLIELIYPEDIFDSLIQILEKIFPSAGNILFFSFDKEARTLSLKRSAKDTINAAEEKKGSSLEKWVLRQNRSLLIDDITKDFRFDCSKLAPCHKRKSRAFALSPLSIGQGALGVVRLENQNAGAFSLDDSRLLRNICDLGAVVLERSILFRETQELAIKDSLTGLYVKSYFSDYLAKELKRVHKQKCGLGLIILDIDDFKKINDSYGHAVGDLVLVKLAAILTQVLGAQQGMVSRFGGEEFTLALSGIDQKSFVAFAEEICRTVSTTNLVFRRKKINFTVSLGVAFYPESSKTPLGLIEAADRLLYRAKRQGKNKVCYFGQ